MSIKKNKKSREKGLSLSEMTIVLGISLVLTAILLPAIAGTNPDRAENILSAAASPVVVAEESELQPFTLSREDFVQRYDRRENRRDQSVPENFSDEILSPTQESRLQREGLKHFLTTDIRSGQR